MAYKAPVRDLTFILNEVLEIDRYTNQPGFQDVSSELAQQILEEAARFADEVIAPINHSGDKEGCHYATTGQSSGADLFFLLNKEGVTTAASYCEFKGEGKQVGGATIGPLQVVED